MEDVEAIENQNKDLQMEVTKMKNAIKKQKIDYQAIL